MEASRLEELRQHIDQLDSEMISLLARRFQLTEEVGIYKASNKLSAQDPSRESKQFNKITELASRNELNPEYAIAIYRCLMDVVILRHKEIEQSYMQNNRIGQI
ncbi:chorismate mutase [Paenibacillus sp. PL91]|uniref:chorismate mutase n=1 Tax=Paenibacillus sp. PL91 TaxID=2729538 RepID=UPI00145FBAA7|nr:chorismate mutase [Paenibacillus sp. PL91]MBC9201230.1 chorismate mutase [Paenibacillus sp. PL91]